MTTATTLTDAPHRLPAPAVVYFERGKGGQFNAIRYARDLARRPLSADCAAAVTYTYRVAGMADRSVDLGPAGSPFRAPHHTCSKAGLLGTLRDGWRWTPGELSLAHGGVLLLDEITEWTPAALRAIEGCVRDQRIRLVGPEQTAIEMPWRRHLSRSRMLWARGFPYAVTPCSRSAATAMRPPA